MTSAEFAHDLAGTPEDEPRFEPSFRGVLHERLGAFLGRWRTEGQAYEGPFGPAARITATETYEWLPGSLFLIHRLEGRLGGQRIACLEVLGCDTSKDACSVRSFYNDGTHNVWQAREKDGIWTFSGSWERDGRTLGVRCTSVFSEDGDTVTGTWEYSPDGSAWHRFWETRLTRA
jgi:hypothetical protein